MNTQFVKNIIVPMDFSNEAMPGLHFAMMLADTCHANIHMVHVVKNNGSKEPAVLKNDRVVAALKFDEILQTFNEKRTSKYSIAYTIAEGQVFKQVNELADTLDDVLIVLTTHGESGFEELFMGGNAYKITSHSKNPVITIRKNIVPARIDKIVLPLDITFQTREKVPYTVQLAKLFHSEIHLCSVRMTNAVSIEHKLQQYIDQVAAYIGKQDIPCVIQHLYGDNLTDITLDYAKTINADLISIMTGQEISISNLLLGSYAHQMINKALLPVLSFPNYHLRIVTENIWDLGAFNPRD